MIFVFDLDGTLCLTRDANYDAAEPHPDAIRRVNQLHAAGHRTIIDTARGSGTGIDWTALTREQLATWGVKYHRLRCGVKFPADRYVGDEAVNVDDWLAVERCPACDGGVLETTAMGDERRQYVCAAQCGQTWEGEVL